MLRHLVVAWVRQSYQVLRESSAWELLGYACSGGSRVAQGVQALRKLGAQELFRYARVLGRLGSIQECLGTQNVLND